MSVSIQRIGLNGTAVVRIPVADLRANTKEAAGFAGENFIVGYAHNWDGAKATRVTLDAEGQFYSVTLRRVRVS